MNVAFLLDELRMHEAPSGSAVQPGDRVVPA